MIDQHKRHDARSGVRKSIDIGVGLVVAALLLHGCDAPASAASPSPSVKVDKPGLAASNTLQALTAKFII